MMNKRSGMASRLSRCMKAPVRMFCRACDFYVRGISSCAGKVPGGGGGALYPPMTTLPRSFSVQSARTSTSGDDDLRELIRAASVSRRDVGKATAPLVVPRSHSVAVGRIDEDKPCEFEDDVRLGAGYMFPRSRSYAVASKWRVGAFA